jgi:hypothetical protein
MMFYVLFMCKCVLPPGVNPIAVGKYINIIIIIIIIIISMVNIQMSLTYAIVSANDNAIKYNTSPN